MLMDLAELGPKKDMDALYRVVIKFESEELEALRAGR